MKPDGHAFVNVRFFDDGRIRSYQMRIKKRSGFPNEIRREFTVSKYKNDKQALKAALKYRDEVLRKADMMHLVTMERPTANGRQSEKFKAKQ